MNVLLVVFFYNEAYSKQAVEARYVAMSHLYGTSTSASGGASNLIFLRGATLPKLLHLLLKSCVGYKRNAGWEEVFYRSKHVNEAFLEIVITIPHSLDKRLHCKNKVVVVLMLAKHGMYLLPSYLAVNNTNSILELSMN